MDIISEENAFKGGAPPPTGLTRARYNESDRTMRLEPCHQRCRERPLATVNSNLELSA
jgi:hypothetical protein